MSETHKLPASKRDRAGKGAARAVRRTGLVPAVIYGNKQEPSLIALEQKRILKELKRSSFFATLYDITVDGKSEKVLPRDVQFDPVTDFPIHLDFLRVSATAKVNVMVPVLFTNELAAPGIKQGGMLNIVRHEIELICSADHIPSEITIDLTGRVIGDSIHISHVNLPADTKPAITDRDFTIATIVAPGSVRAEAAEAGAAEASEDKAETEKKSEG